MIGSERMPYQTAVGETYDCGEFTEVWIKQSAWQIGKASLHDRINRWKKDCCAAGVFQCISKCAAY